MTENSLHREIIELHAQNPHCNQKLEDFSHQGFFQSEKTGNQCDLQFLVDNGVITQVGYHLQGSALATAAASLLAIEIQGMNTADANRLAHRMVLYLLDSTADSLPGDLCVYQSIRRFPERFDCALLPCRALLKALEV